MAGISSKAAGEIENRKKYNGIEFGEDFDVDSYEAYYRNLDPQIGRWWQIDPKIEDVQEYISPYSSMADNPISKVDPLGDLPCCEASYQVFMTTQEVSGSVLIGLGGPGNPLADAVAGGIEVGGSLISVGVLAWEYYTDNSNNAPVATDISAPPTSIQPMPTSDVAVTPEAINTPQITTGPGGLVIPQNGPELPLQLQVHGNSIVAITYSMATKYEIKKLGK